MAIDEGAISSLLSSPEGIQKIMSVIRLMTGGDGQGETPSALPAPPAEETAPDPAPEATPASTTALPAMSSLMSLLSGVGGGDGGLDPRLLSVVTSVISGFGDASNNARINLLIALKPFLNEHRRGQVDNAIQAVRIARAAVMAINGWTKAGGERHV